MEYNFEKTDMKEILSGLFEEFNASLSKSKMKNKAKALKLMFKADPDADFLINADKNSLRQVFSNLIDNAIKYTEKGTITITESQTDSLGTISVKDTGIGINQKDMPHIFEKFYASENWLQKQNESHGLGLYIAKLFLKLMGGSIMVESKVGEGSTFSKVSSKTTR